MRIIAAGGACPPTQAHMEFLENQGLIRGITGDGLRRVEGYGRCTTLPLEYLGDKAHGGVADTFAARQYSASQLGAEAVREALTAASLVPSEISLLIADTATQHQTCPSEAARIGEALGATCPCYDLVGLAGAMPLHTEAMVSFKPETTPAFAVSVSTDVATQYVSYAVGEAGAESLWPLLATDGAGALLFSSAPTPGFEVRLVQYASLPAQREKARLTMQGCLSGGEQELFQWMREETTGLLKQIVSHPAVQGRSVSLIAPPLLDTEVNDCCERAGLSVAWRYSAVEEVGFLWGSYPSVVLARNWNSIQRSLPLVIVAAGVGHTSGAIILEWMD